MIIKGWAMGGSSVLSEQRTEMKDANLVETHNVG